MKPLFTLICGHMASGKSTLTQKITEKNSSFNVVNADLIRQFFRESFPFYSDLDESFPTQKTSEANTIINPFRYKILELLIKNDQNIILNQSSLTKETRKKILEKIPKRYSKLIIQTRVNGQEHIKRIKERDSNWTHSKNWERFHNELRKDNFEELDSNECENTIIYDQENTEEILSLISKLTK